MPAVLLIALWLAVALPSCTNDAVQNQTHSVQKWIGLNEAAREEVKQGSKELAETKYQTAIAEAEMLSDKLPLATSLFEVSELHHKTGESEKCIGLLKRSLELAKNELRGKNIENDKTRLAEVNKLAASSAHALANFYCEQGKFPEADPLYDQAKLYAATTDGGVQIAEAVQKDQERMHHIRDNAKAQVDSQIEAAAAAERNKNSSPMN